MLLKITFLLLLSCLTVIAHAFDCSALKPTTSSETTSVKSEDIKEVEGTAETLFRIGSLDGEFKSVAKKEIDNFYSKFPNAGEILLKERMIYFYCQMLSESTLGETEKFDRLNAITAMVFSTEPQKDKKKAED